MDDNNQKSTKSRLFNTKTLKAPMKAQIRTSKRHSSVILTNKEFRLSYNNNDKYKRKITNTHLQRYLNSLQNFNMKEDLNKNEQFDIYQKGFIDLAKQHSLANRPIKVIREPTPDDDIQFCKCCGLPCIKPGLYETFKISDNTDTYSVLGEAISLYFSFYKFTIFILLVALCALVIPSFYMVNVYYSSLSKMCDKVKVKNFKICDNYYKVQGLSNNNTNQNTVTFTSQLNAVNLISYIELYNTLMEHNMNDTSLIKNKYGKIMEKIVINNSISYFIVLISLFIINLLYIIFQNNKILYYNFRVISPSDYAVIISNMSNVFNSYHHMKFRYLKNKKYNPRDYRKKLGFIGSELKDKSITDAMEFSAFIKKFVINKKEKYDIETVNICYKLDKYTKLKEKADIYNEYLFELENNPDQIKKNRQLRLQGNRRIFFQSLFPGVIAHAFDFFGCTNDFCSKKISIIDILQKRRNKEKELNLLLEDSYVIKKSNFANVVFVSFSTINEQEKFLEKYRKNLFEKIIFLFKNFKYIFCECFITNKREILKTREIDEFIEVSPAPEPDDIIFENLSTKKIDRILLVCFTTFISFLFIAISFIIVVLLTMAQEKINNLSFGEKNFSKYAVSIAMTGIISTVNIILEIILEKLTKIESHISLTNFNLSFSVKLSICTFVNSAIVPLISNICANIETLEIHYELLVSNMLTMFVVNSVVSPLMWTFNVGFYINKLLKWKIERKKNNLDMNQKKLNELYEYMDINLAYKYSYLSKTLLMTFFYLPVFPLGLAISMAGFILGFYLEKFNIGHRYKRPEMMNKTICKFYTNFFEVNFLMLALGDYIFLKGKYNLNYWPYINLAIFFLLLILPFGRYLEINFLGINQSNVVEKNYDEAYFVFHTDYELINPLTIKKGRINYLERLKELNYLSKEEFNTKKKRILKTSFLKIISEAKPKRVDPSIGFRRGLLTNINIEESDTKPKRLFQLIKKLNQAYKLQEEKENDIEITTSSIDNYIIETNRKKIPNIVQLVETIFGFNDEENDSSGVIKKNQSEKNNPDFIKKSKSLELEYNFIKNKLSKKEPNKPFVIPALNKNNKNNKNNDVINSSNMNTETLPIINETENDKIINENDEYTNKTKNYELNTIINAIKNEIESGKKNLLRYSDWEINNSTKSSVNTKTKETETETNKSKQRRLNTTRSLSNSKNTLNSKGNISYVSNISVTINQYFDRNKDNKNTSPNKLFDINDTIIENDEEDNKTENDYQTSRKKVISLNQEDEDNENQNIEKRPINNIINIVVNNDNNNTNNNEEDKNKDSESLNEYINVK